RSIRMIRFNRIWGLLLAATLGVACSDDTHSGGAFECQGNECVCPASGDCWVSCVGSCDLQCAGSGACDFACGVECEVACTGSGVCVVSGGEAGSVQCPGPGGGAGHRVGDCVLVCPGSGDRLVRCDPSADCPLDHCIQDLVTCPSGVQPCSGPCPPECRKPILQPVDSHITIAP